MPATHCLQCGKPMPEGSARLCADGKVTWTATPESFTAGPGRVLDGHAEFCCIRCYGTYIGIALERAGLIPPKAPKAN